MLSDTKQSFEAKTMPSLRPWMDARNGCSKSLGLEELNKTRGGWEGELSLQLTQWVMAGKCAHVLELRFIVPPKLSVTTLTWLKGV